MARNTALVSVLIFTLSIVTDQVSSQTTAAATTARPVTTAGAAVTTAAGATTARATAAVTTARATVAVTTARAGAAVTTAAAAAAAAAGNRSLANAFVEDNNTVSQSMVADFDCRRSGHDCGMNGGVCDLDLGVCTCNDGFIGFDCGYELIAMANLSLCNNGKGCGEDPDSTCVAGHGNDTKATCFCGYNVFGAGCDKTRYELRCSESFLSINLSPFSTDGKFKGHVFVINSQTNIRIDDPACTFANASADGVTSLRVSYSNIVSKCGGNQSDNGTTNELKFIVQNDPDWLTTFDQVVTAKCMTTVRQEYQKTIIVDAAGGAVLGRTLAQPGGATVKISSDLVNLPPNQITGERKKVEVLRKIPTPIITLGHQETVADVQIIKPITGTVKLGDVVVVTIENVNDTFYQAIRAEDCTINMDDIMEARLIKDQCPYSRFAWSLLQWSKTIVTNQSISFFLRLPANAIAGMPRQVTVSCRVKLCAEDMIGECAMDDNGCHNATSKFLPPSVAIKNYGRKRRSADDTPAGANANDLDPTAFAYVQKTFDIMYDELTGSSSSSNRRKPSSSYAATSGSQQLLSSSSFSLVLLLISMRSFFL